MANKQKALMWVMFVVILILVLVLAYVFLVQPALTGYTVDRQIEGYNIGYSECITNVVTTALQNNLVQLPMGDGQTLVLEHYQRKQYYHG